MKRLISVLLAMLFTLGLCGTCMAQVYADAAAFVQDIPTTQFFTDDAVAKEDIDKILLAGVNSPSSMNSQPWHFTAITDPAVLAEIAGGMQFGGPASFDAGSMPESMSPPEGTQIPEGFENSPFPGGADLPDGFPQGEIPSASAGMPSSKAGLTDAPLAIVVSCQQGSELDAGLACQSMYIEAQLLGYGAKIISSPTIALNGDRKAEFDKLLGIPEGQSAAAILLVGVSDISDEQTADAAAGATQRNPLDEVVTYLQP